jgi:transcriptional regulator with XRE-family HTH domain
LIRGARRQSGLTQRALAERAGTRQPTISAYETGHKIPSAATLERLVQATGGHLTVVPDHTLPFTAVSVARRVGECVTQEPPQRNEALRWVVELIDEFRRTDPANRPAMVAQEPEPTGSRKWDALLAACVEWLCAAAGVAIPAWTRRPERFLDRWWFVTPYRSLHASAFVHTPAPFANRGVFIHRSSLESV